MLSTPKLKDAIVVPAELTGPAEDRFEECLRAVLETCPPTVLLDCAPLQRVTSRHVELLWRTQLRCQRHTTEVRLENPTPGLIRVLTVLDLAELFNCAPLEAEAAPGTAAAGAGPAKANYKDTFGPTDDTVVPASERYGAFLADLPIPELIRFELRTIFYEVANNISQHGGIGDGSPIRFWAEFGSARIIMTFTDTGRAYDPTTADGDFDPRAAAKKRRVRGFGIPMVRRMTDAMSYVRSADDRNILTIVKTWSV
ncbi:MAG: ATP-binding protein [candidate division Zixibacteria bacterium]|nr:ATP-binding protein [candidate division Zixibacteria bacterium]